MGSRKHCNGSVPISRSLSVHQEAVRLSLKVTCPAASAVGRVSLLPISGISVSVFVCPCVCVTVCLPGHLPVCLPALSYHPRLWGLSATVPACPSACLFVICSCLYLFCWLPLGLPSSWACY